ncbi:hypothetical protein [Siccirubricoccus phaeus]|uniref:hypothetical protein n=1 Tax=Siccirubricoccus phaeus TaxID=2595053 RepID=UPI0011F21072|nr:hypothetical protein [Siccirubricoccus phaeus]
MAADDVELDPEREAAGAALLDLTDEIGFHAYAAAWVRNRDTDEWHFVLVSPMVDTRGPRWIFERLLRAFRIRPLPAGISPMQIHVVSPAWENAIFGAPHGFRFSIEPQRPSHLIATLKDVVVNDVKVGDGYAAIYRRLPLDKRKRNPAEYFDRGVRNLEAA